MLKPALLFSLPLVLCGCANYPLPQDVAGPGTEAIVHNLRCEARAAVRHAALDELRTHLDGTTIYTVPKGRSYSGPELAAALEQGSVRFNIKDLTGPIRTKFEYYSHTQIAFDFTLDGNESNTQGIQLGLTKGIATPIDTIALHGTSSRVRDVSRSFVTVDTFENLADKVTDQFCQDAFRYVNIVYPIAGKLDVFDLVDNYIKLNSFDSLSNKDATSKPQGTHTQPAIPIMADTIVFTTTLTANIDPTLNYSPLAKVFSLTSLGIQNDNARQDKHTVIATLITEPVDPKTKQAPNPDKVREDAATAVQKQREKLVQDSIISIGSALSQPGAGLSVLGR